jgi:hypothetical protein
MIIQDWERERNMEDVYLFEKQCEIEMEYWNSLKRKPAKIRIDDKIKCKPRVFRRISKKRIFSGHSIFANVY